MSPDENSRNVDDVSAFLDYPVIPLSVWAVQLEGFAHRKYKIIIEDVCTTNTLIEFFITYTKLRNFV